jgi:putative peptidoglycan lipid II flippase
LPKLSNLVIDKKYQAISDSMSLTMRLMGIFIIPAAVLFLFFGDVIAKVLYFGIPTDDANYLGLTLSAFALGLIPVSINLVLLRGLNAFENLKSQVVGNLIMNIISVVLSLVAAFYLEPKWVTVGLAAIFTVHYFIGAGISFILIKKHGVQIPVLSLVAFYLKLIFIFVLSAMPIWLARELDLGGNLIYLLLVLSTSALIYLVLLKALKITEVTTLIKVIKGRRE